MKRRHFLTGIGALAVGSGLAMGTGAFSTTSAERSFSVTSAGDAAAALQIGSGSGNSADSVVSTSNDGGDEIVDLSFGNINQNARVAFDGILKITNNSQKGAIIEELEFRPEESDGTNVDGIYVYQTASSASNNVDQDPIQDDTQVERNIITGFGSAVGSDGNNGSLQSGESIEVGFLFDTRVASLEDVEHIEIIARTSESGADV